RRELFRSRSSQKPGLLTGSAFSTKVTFEAMPLITIFSLSAILMFKEGELLSHGRKSDVFLNVFPVKSKRSGLTGTLFRIL
ncbi:hypothetical protein ACQP3L_37960, partial [Escherichia coli]